MFAHPLEGSADIHKCPGGPGAGHATTTLLTSEATHKEMNWPSVIQLLGGRAERRPQVGLTSDPAADLEPTQTCATTKMSPESSQNNETMEIRPQAATAVK